MRYIYKYKYIYIVSTINIIKMADRKKIRLLEKDNKSFGNRHSPKHLPMT